MIVFVEFLPIIASFLDAETSLEPKAGLLLSAIPEPRFLVGLVTAEYVLSHTVSPSKELQSSIGNLFSAYQTIGEVKDFLRTRGKMRRQNSKIFSSELKSYSRKLDPLTIPFLLSECMGVKLTETMSQRQ